MVINESYMFVKYIYIYIWFSLALEQIMRIINSNISINNYTMHKVSSNVGQLDNVLLSFIPKCFTTKVQIGDKYRQLYNHTISTNIVFII